MTKPGDRDRDAERYEDSGSAMLDPGEVVGKLPRTSQRLGGAVPVRFSPDSIERIKQIADEDGMTVSTWIREQVNNALESRTQRRSMIVVELTPYERVDRRVISAPRRRLSA